MPVQNSTNRFVDLNNALQRTLRDLPPDSRPVNTGYFLSQVQKLLGQGRDITPAEYQEGMSLLEKAIAAHRYFQDTPLR
jgi:hypothetical protein